MFETPIFDALHQGDSNRFARVALSAIAHSPGDLYNPLWLYGPSGIGKTALLDATAAALRDHLSRPLILRIHAEQLVQDMIHAIQHHSTAELRARLLGFQVIVLDHTDSLIGKSFTQAQVGQLLVMAAQQGCQVILASSCKPDLLDSLEQTLAAHCPWLLCCDVPAPEPEERLLIAQRMARERKLPLTDPMVHRIANATQTPAQIQCIILHLAARRKLLQLAEDALPEALDHLLEREAWV